MEYIRTHLQAIVAIAPRREPLETPIKVEKVDLTDYYNTPYTTKRITKVDNAWSIPYDPGHENKYN